MPRIQELPYESASPATRAIYDGLRDRYGEVLQSVAVTARHPEVLDAYLHFERKLHRAALLEPRLKHLVELKVAAHLGCAFCIDLGSYLGAAGGVTEAQIVDLPAYRTSAAFSERERTALDYAMAMSGVRSEVPDALFARLRAEFTDEQILELTGVAAWENFRGRFNRALDLQAHGFAAGSVCALPEL
jgi:4-carboxymuconolactone decarboxylase